MDRKRRNNTQKVTPQRRWKVHRNALATCGWFMGVSKSLWFAVIGLRRPLASTCKQGVQFMWAGLGGLRSAPTNVQQRRFLASGHAGFRQLPATTIRRVTCATSLRVQTAGRGGKQLERTYLAIASQNGLFRSKLSSSELL